MRLYTATHGTVHSITVGSWWERLKERRFISRSLQFIGMRPTRLLPKFTLSTPQETTVFWIEHTGQGEDLNLTRSDWRATVADEQGVPREVLVPFDRVYTPVMAWRPQGEPLSGKKLTLNIHMRDPARTNDWLHVAKFRIRNPAR